jgi:hypothetical protein
MFLHLLFSKQIGDYKIGLGHKLAAKEEKEHGVHTGNQQFDN